MKTVACGFALVLGAAFLSIGVVASPAHADRCDQFRPPGAPPNALWQECEDDNVLIASAGTPICQQSTAPNGASDCAKCLDALSNTSIWWFTQQVAYDCGHGGTNMEKDQNNQLLKPQCYVGTFDTGRRPPDCNGRLNQDGSVSDIT